MSKESIIARLDRSWQEWLSALDGIPAERTAEPGVCGYYSIKDLIGHIAFWDERDLDRAKKTARGEIVPPADWEAMNDREYEERRNESLETQNTWMLEAHDRLRTGVQALEPLDDTLKLSETWEHYDEHCAQVRAWRASHGFPAETSVKPVPTVAS